jgi:hypothetical protein
MMALGSDAARAFAERLTAHLLAHYPSSSAALGGRNEVFAFVERTIAKANGFGIESTGAVSTLAELTIQFGEDFERSPIREWSRNILAHPELPGSSKAEAIRERHTEATQGRVIIRY